GVDPREHQFHRRFHRLVVAQYAIGLLRPYRLPVAHPPPEAAGLAQPLGFGRMRLAAPQRGFGALLVLDVEAYAVPLDHLSLLAAQWHAADEMPAVLAIGAQEAELHLEWLAGRQAVGPHLLRASEIVWMDDRWPIDMSSILARGTGEFPPGQIGKIPPSVGQIARDNRRDGVDGRLQLASCAANLLPRPVLPRDVGIALQDGARLSTLAPLQRPPARDGHLRPIALGVDELPFPAAGAGNRRKDFLDGLRKARLQQLIRDLADRL